MKNKRLLIMGIVLLMSVMTAACENGNSGRSSCGPDTDESTRSEIQEAETGVSEIEPADLVYSTNPAGTGYYAIGAGQGGLLSSKTPLNVIVTPSTGPEGIVAALKSGETQLAINNPEHFTTYWKDSEGLYDLSDIRSIQNGNTLCFSFVVNADSGINTVEDLRGKRVTFDGLSDTHKTMSEAILKAYGIDPEKDVQRMKMSFSTSGLTELAEGRTDACIASISGSKLDELASKISPRVLAVNEAQAAEVSSVYPSVVPARLGSEVPGGEKGLPCIGMPTALFCVDDLSEDIVYVITKTLMENYDSLSQICEELREWTPDAAVSKDAKFPYHRGAIKYYEEIGLWDDQQAPA